MSEGSQRNSEQQRRVNSNEDRLDAHQALGGGANAAPPRHQRADSSRNTTSIATSNISASGGVLAPPVLAALLGEASGGGVLERLSQRSAPHFPEAHRYIQNLIESVTEDTLNSTLTEIDQIAKSSDGAILSIQTQSQILKSLLLAALPDSCIVGETGKVDTQRQRQRLIGELGIRNQVNRLIQNQNLPTISLLAVQSAAKGKVNQAIKLFEHFLRYNSKDINFKETRKQQYKKQKEPSLLSNSQAIAIAAAIIQGGFPSEGEDSYFAITKTLLHKILELDEVDNELVGDNGETNVDSDKLSLETIQGVLFLLETNETFTKEAELKERSITAIEKLKNIIRRNMDGSSSPTSGKDISHVVSSASGRLPLFSSESSVPGEQITNFLADLGPACTSSASTLRETLSEVANSLLLSSDDKNDSRSATNLDEASIARLICFFADKASSDRSNTEENSLSAALVNALLPSSSPSAAEGSSGDADRSKSSGSSGWNLNSFSQILSEDCSRLDWEAVAHSLDFLEFDVKNVAHLEIILKLYRSGAKTDIPSSAIVSEWRNQSGQLSLIEQIIVAPTHVFTFQVSEAEAADAATAGDRCANKSWASGDLLQRLLQLSDVPLLARRVRDLFVKGLLTCPEVLLCSLVRLQLNVASAAANNDGSAAQSGLQMKGELMRELIPLFFKPNTRHRVQDAPAAIRRLWAISPNTVAAACIEAWRSTASETPLSRLATALHVIGIIRLLPDSTGTILNSNKDHEFSIAVAFVMADNDMLQLGLWLNERMTSGGGGIMFVVTLVAYLGKTYALATPRSASSNNETKEESLVSLENLAISLQFLQSIDRAILSQPIPSAGNASESAGSVVLGDSVRALTEACLTKHPSLKAVVPSFASFSTPGPDAAVSTTSSGSNNNADDIEEMANSYFQKIYTSEQSIGEVVEMLKRFKTSGNARENDIFACMIHNLFDEYRFFSKYPEKELRITGILFGTLIQHQLVSSITLGIALRYVLEALRKPPGPPGNTTSNSGKMFRFGMFALEQFKSRLHEWPQYCSHIVQIPHLKQGYADLVAEIEAAMAESQSRGSASGADSTNLNTDKTTDSTAGDKRTSDSSSPSSVTESQKANSDVSSPAHRADSRETNSLPNQPHLAVSGISGSGTDQHQPGLTNGSNNVINFSVNNMNQMSVSGPSNMALTPPAIPLAIKQLQHPTRAVAVFGPGLGRAVNGQIDSAESQHEAPPDAVLDRVQFLINNVSPSNVEQKAQELKDLLAPKYFGWLGHYLVVKRISTQPNFHSLYLAFLGQLGDYGKGLVEAILSSVYLNVGKLLRSPKITTSTSERSLLKNLGSWLGQITLARNRPILQVMLDCKELLFQGYETGMLIAVTPFVAKILEGAKNSVVFRPPNPWLMGLLSVFRSLYEVDDLKMNIKFEVEVLCKNLGVKLEDIPLKAEDLAKRIPPIKERNPDFNMKSSMMSHTPAGVQGVGAAPSTGSVSGVSAGGQSTSTSIATSPSKQVQGLGPSPAASGMALAASDGARQYPSSASAPAPTVSGAAPAGGSVQDQQQTVIPNLAAYVTINPSLVLLFQQPHGVSSTNINGSVLKRAVPIAVDRAIREIIQPVVERSVTIACITTKEIVTKDYAMESDENKMRKAAQLMVANLAGSLALVTCREPLRASISTHLRQLLMNSAGNSTNGTNSSSQLSEQEQNAIEQCVAICATDNLELGCMLIEKAATEKAVRDMDESLAPALSARRKHREQTGQPFYDMSIFGSGSNRYPAALPEPLRPKPGGLRNDQLLVYEAFQRMPRQPVVPGSQQQATAVGGATGSVVGSPAGTTTTIRSGSVGAVSSPVISNRITAGTTKSSAIISSAAGGGGSATGQHQIGLEALSAITAKLDNAVSTLLSAAGPRAPEITLAMIPPDHEVRQLILAVRRVTASSTSTGTSGGRRMLSSAETDAVLVFAQGLFKRLYDLSLSEPLRLEVLIALLEALNEFCPQLGQDLGTWATYAPTETEGQRKLHRTVILLLVRSRLVSVGEIDSFLARNMDGGRNATWVEFSFLFVRTAIMERISSASDMPKVMEILTKVGEGRIQGGQQINQAYLKPIRRLLEELRGSSVVIEQKQQQCAPTNINKESGSSVPVSLTVATGVVGQGNRQQLTHQQSSSIGSVSLSNLAGGTKKAAEAIEIISRNDPPGMRQQVTFLLDSWIRVHNEAPGSEKALAQYLQLLQQHGVGKADDITERFFRFSTELVVEACLKTSVDAHSGASKDPLLSQGKVLNYGVVDAYAKLVALLIRYMNAGGTAEQVAAQRISLLNKVLGTTVRALMSNYERCKQQTSIIAHWDQRPWFRLFLNLVHDLNSPSPALDPISLGILSIFGSAFHVVQPLVVPGFAFAWLELISHRMFLPNILLIKGQKGWGVAHQLLIDLFLFLEPHLRKTELTDAIKHLYKGTLRVLLVLLHDFPSFLAGYHVSFCNVIPENCVQLRNLILSAFPRGMVLPDPFTPNLKIDRLTEISQSPVILSNVAGPLDAMRSDLDGYLKSRQPVNFVSNLLPRLYKEGTNDVDAPRINSLVLYVGIQAIARLQNSQMAPQIAHTPEMEILHKLMDFDDRGRYISLNAIANQLRYPSSHTHYFSCVMLYLFSEAKDDGVKEQVTRVLLERLIVHRPHPWGLLITFIELIKNQRYQFWSHSFTHCATEIEKVFESVARSCMNPESQRSATAGGDDPQ